MKGGGGELLVGAATHIVTNFGEAAINLIERNKGPTSSRGALVGLQSS